MLLLPALQSHVVPWIALGGQESLGLQVSLIFLLFTLKGHYLQVLHLGRSRKLNLALLAISTERRLLPRGVLG